MMLVTRGFGIAARWMAAAAVVSVGVWSAGAQSCTTQSKLNGPLRDNLRDVALGMAGDVKSGNAAKVQGEAIPAYASNFGSTSATISGISPKIAADTLRVTQIYVLDARNRKSADSGDADFSCQLANAPGETDFSISGLPPGIYAFVMVEASGPQPWLISLLLQQDGGSWKLAGLYTHARTADGHDGEWFWTKARAAAASKDLWLAWLYYGQADSLLRPSNFATSTNLDKLRSEQRAATPPELADGIGTDNPLVLKGANGAEFRFTSIASEGSEDGKQLELTLHYAGDPAVSAPAQENSQNMVAANTLLMAHKGLRPNFDTVVVVDDVPGRSPYLTELKSTDVH